MAGRRSLRSNIVCLIALGAGLLAPPALAHRVAPPPAPTPDRSAFVVMDSATGRVLSADNPDALRRPASLTKLMTLYMTFEALRDRRISLDEQVPFSEHAASMIPTKLGVPAGSSISVEDAILSMVTLSANDAAAAMGELLGGSEERFAQLMTLRARALGMAHTMFTNASGLPADDQWTTARDMAVLGRHLVADFPDEYHYFSTPSFDFHGRIILNHDTELRSYPGADGMKTGYTVASGHNLVTSSVRDGVRLIGVEFGAPSNGVRDIRMTAMLNAGYQSMGIETGSSAAIASRLPTLIPAARASEPARPGRPLVRKVMHTSATGAERPAYAIQVGSFRSRQAAEEAAVKAHAAADAGDVRLTHAQVARHDTWRVQIVGLSDDAAHEACSELVRHRRPCVVLRSAETEQLARG